ncbi:MAG: adenylate/guanylate cyclase domain-containing protein [Spirochaetaceae bacterium]|nr:adenylate/guanylate cyclase domain-containing protein [Spirochaetaceae bacterium]
MGLQTDQLIFNREKQGITISITAKILTLIVFILMQISLSHDSEELNLVLTIVGPALIILIIAFFILLKVKRIHFIGALSLLIDIAIITVLPFIWYNSVGGEALIPRTYLLKTAIPYIVYLLMVVNTLTIRPVYPLILSISATGYFIFLFVYAAQDPRFQITHNMVESLMGPATSIYLYSAFVVMIFFTGIVLAFLAWQARKTIIQSAVSEVQNNQLSRYFSPNVAEEIMNEEESFFKPGGKSQEVAVFFSDIRGFTRISEEYPANEVFDLLTDYHSFMASILFKYGGTLDKFMGDGILATFGTPYSTADDAENALQAAVEMREALETFNEKRKNQGLFTIEHGIGIHYGPVIVGNIGMKDRLEYTVIGDTVNIASRVESACKPLNEDILITESIVDKLPVGFVLKKLKRVRFKNKSEPFQLYGVAEN